MHVFTCTFGSVLEEKFVGDAEVMNFYDNNVVLESDYENFEFKVV